MLSIDEETEQLTVRFGIMKMNVGIGEIESLSGQKRIRTQRDEEKTVIPGATQKNSGVS